MMTIGMNKDAKSKGDEGMGITSEALTRDTALH